MGISKKTAIIMALTIGLLMVSLSWMQNRSYQGFKSEELFNTMKTILANGETVAEGYAQLQKKGAFNVQELQKQMQLQHDFRQTTMYKTVPIIAALESMQKLADINGFSFRTPKLNPRNTKNYPDALEKEIISYFKQSKAASLERIDRDHGLVFHAKPVIIQESCLVCHGNPAKSPTANGKDLFGFAMENWKAGDIVGAYVVSAPIDRLDAQVQEAFLSSLFVMLALGVLAIVLGFIYMNRSVVKPVYSSLDRLNEESKRSESAATALLNINNNVNAGTQKQAVAIDQIAKTTDEIHQKFSTSLLSTDYSESALGHAEAALVAVENGLTNIQELNKNMAGIQNQSKEIGSIATTVDTIAFQTNLLALNAAVEAARAGEHGNGFAVVADEVRALSLRASEAAKNTTHIVEQSVQYIDKTSQMTALMIQALKEVEQRVEALLSSNNAISQMSAEQLASIEEIRAALLDIQEVTVANAQASEHASQMTGTVSLTASGISKHMEEVRWKLLG